METTIVYWGFIWIMEKKMEATVISSLDYLSRDVS